MLPFRLLAAGLALTTVAACQALTFPESRDEPALVAFYGDTAAVEVADTVDRATPFEIGVVTFGGGCTRSIARTELRRDERTIEIRPFNRTYVAEACTDDLLYLRHRASLQVDEPGPLRIRVVGRHRGTATGGRNEPVVVERSVHVR